MWQWQHQLQMHRLPLHLNQYAYIAIHICNVHKDPAPSLINVTIIMKMLQHTNHPTLNPNQNR